MVTKAPGRTEFSEQIAVVSFCDWNRIPIAHITNEGKRSVVMGAQLKKAGLRPGFPDLFIPVACNGYHGLFIEMKVGKNKATENQKEWLTLLAREGYKTHLCYGADEAINAIKMYIKQKGE